MFKQVRLNDAVLKFYHRSQPIAFSNAESLYEDLVLLRDQILMYGDLSEAQTNYLNEFIEKFDTTLSTSVRDIFEKWLNDNFLVDLIRDVINEEVIEARGGKATLKDRLDETTSQLAQTMSQVDFDSWVATLLDGGPSIFMDTLALLQSTYPQGSAGVALVRETDPARVYVWNGSSWQDYGAYQGIEIKKESVTNDKIAQNSVTPDKTVFFNFNGNYFNKNATRYENRLYNWDGTYGTDPAFYSFIQKVDPSSTYIKNNVGSNYRLAFFDKDELPLGVGVEENGWTSFTTTPLTHYISMSFGYAENLDLSKIMLIKGTKLPDYFIPYGYNIKSDYTNKNTVINKNLYNLLVFGDSITETSLYDESGNLINAVFRVNWPTNVNKNGLFKKITNFARSGASIHDVAEYPTDKRKSLSEQVNMAIANNEPADVIVVSCGTNDGDGGTMGTYENAMSKSNLNDLNKFYYWEALRWNMWKLRTEYPNAIMFWALPIQRADHELADTLIEPLVTMAKRYNFIIIDAMNESGIVRDFEVNGGAGRYLSDGLHPNTLGIKLLTDYYEREIRSKID